MKKYVKPQAEISAFESEDIITTSGISIPTHEAQTLTRKGLDIGKISGLFD